MGVGRIFPGGIGAFFKGKPRITPVDAKKGDILFFPLENKKTTIFF